MGAKGSISVTANVAPKKLRQMCEKALAGDADGARAIDAKLQPLHRDLFVQSSPIPVKWAVCELGLIEKGIRLPMTWLTAECESIVRNAMVAAELN
jgi:4-hydroxy-tetrahydrodipicolinate synthase